MFFLGTNKINQQKIFAWCIYSTNILLGFNRKTLRQEKWTIQNWQKPS